MQLDMDFWFARPPVSFVSMNLISRARWRCSVSGVGGVICVAPVFVLVCVLVLSGLVSLALVGGGGRGGRGGGFGDVLVDFCWTNEAECLHYGLKTLFSVGDDGGADDGDSAFFSNRAGSKFKMPCAPLGSEHG